MQHGKGNGFQHLRRLRPKDGCTKAQGQGRRRATRSTESTKGTSEPDPERTEAMETLKSGALRGRRRSLRRRLPVPCRRWIHSQRFRPPKGLQKESLESWELCGLDQRSPARSSDQLQGAGRRIPGRRDRERRLQRLCRITIQDATAIADVQAGRTGLSGEPSATWFPAARCPIGHGLGQDPWTVSTRKWKSSHGLQCPRQKHWCGIPYDEIKPTSSATRRPCRRAPNSDALHLSTPQTRASESESTTSPGSQGRWHYTTTPLGGEPMKKIRLDGPWSQEVQSRRLPHRRLGLQGRQSPPGQGRRRPNSLLP